jgi:hypothetical protein
VSQVQILPWAPLHHLVLWSADQAKRIALLIMTSPVVSGCIGPSTAVLAQCGPTLRLVSEGRLHKSTCDHLLPVEQRGVDLRQDGQRMAGPFGGQASEPRVGSDTTPGSDPSLNQGGARLEMAAACRTMHTWAPGDRGPKGWGRRDPSQFGPVRALSRAHLLL